MSQSTDGEIFAYADSPVAIRRDMAESNRRSWERVARPGAWWSGAERVAIAAEVRSASSCKLCRARKDALSPNAVEGEHDSLGGVPEAAVDVVHRVVTDQARLSREWFARTQASGLSEGHYVEIIGVLIPVTTIDSAHPPIGHHPEPLPEPIAGEAPHSRPEGAPGGEGWVSMIGPGRVGAAEADVFDIPRAPNVLRALSLVPDEARGLKDQSAAYYLAAIDVADPSAAGGRAISRQQMELIAGRVAALNECFY